MRSIAAAFLVLVAAVLFAAQTEFRTPTAGSTAQGVVVMCVNSSGQAVSCATTAPLAVTTTSTAATYSAGAPNYTGYASPTDFFSIAGSATKTIKIVNIRLSGYATSTNNIPVALIKRSTANTGGTPSVMTRVPLDSGSAAATATLVTYGTAPTLGTLVGALCACQVELPSTTGVGGSIMEWQFNRNGGSPLILRGVNEMVSMNAYGASFPGGTNLNITIQWIEE